VSAPISPPSRWNHYLLEHGESLRVFWSQHLRARERRLLFILAKGFDPRMCRGLELLLSLQEKGTCDVALVEFTEGATSSSHAYAPMVEENLRRLEKLMAGRGAIQRHRIAIRSDDGRRIASQSALNIFKKRNDLGDYTDIVLDISSAPRGVYLPLMAKILHLLDHSPICTGQPRTNFHLLAWEDSQLDARIQDEGVEERGDFISPFRGGMDREASAGQPRIWIPLLGEAHRIQLERINVLVTPDEICPVLPSPARNPRRGDNLVIEYHDLLFDSWRVEPRNFIYGAEQNPFEVYRQITRAICGYRESFAPLGGAKFVLSALSSKLLSVAALLVAYDFKQIQVEIGIAHVDCHGYRLNPSAAANDGELFSLWLTGEWDAPTLGNPTAAQPTKEPAASDLSRLPGPPEDKK